MKHQGTKTIETPRLILRRFRMEDAPAAFRNWTSDEKVTEFLRWPAHREITTTERVIGEWIAEYDKTDFYQWAIELKEIGEPIGTISTVGGNERTETLHIGYCLGSAWWRRGIMTEAFSAVTGYLFREVGANRLEAWHDPFNPHSGAVMKKCGLKYEGTLRQADYSNRGIVDACVYAVLKEEWLRTPGNEQ